MTATAFTVRPIGRLAHAAPFWMALLTVLLALLAITRGGPWVIALPLGAWLLPPLLDAVAGRDMRQAHAGGPPGQVRWYRLVTLIWGPVQAALLVFALAVVPGAHHLTTPEKAAVFFGLGVLFGAVGIDCAHDLMHRSGRVAGWLADLLLASVFYGHFRSEHLLVHHSYVGTVRDAATARFNEGFYQYFPRLLRDAFISALRAEAGRLAERGVAPWSPANPFWRYGALQGTWIAIALALGGIGGLMLFGLRALTAIWRQELANYIDHYGLTRKYLGDGTYEDVKPRHSWSAGRGASRGPFALHRETDHQDKPGGPSLMQAGRSEEPPLLPSGHLLMAPIAMIPPLWRRVMNPRVRAWRKQFYPEIADWVPYRDGTLPEPRPASADAR